MGIDLSAAVAAPGGYQSGDLVLVSRPSSPAAPYTLPYPAVYTLPAATALARGGVRVDGTTIIISGDVISAVGGGGSGAVGSGTTNQLAYYAGAGTTVSGLSISTSFTIAGGTLSLAQATTSLLGGVTFSATNPAANGSADPGNSAAAARANHVHPTDTSRLAAASNLSDLASAPTARGNLGLGSAATKAASGAGGTVASATGTFTAGHLAVFADTAGTIQDGGAVPGGGTSTVPVTTVATSGASQALAFPAAGSAAYDVTLSASCTFSISGGTAGQMQTITVQVRAGAGGFTTTWPAGVVWKGGSAPSAALASGQLMLVQLRSLDAGTTIVGEF